MELLISSAVGTMTAAGIFLILRSRTFSVVLGLTLLTYATNFFIFASGRVKVNQPDIIAATQADYADPLPQALVLTAIVISFGMTAIILVMSVRSYFETGSDEISLMSHDAASAGDHP